jgi:hypothetical protein
MPITLPGAQTNTLSQVGRLAHIRIVDRTTGSTLPIYEHQGEYWVVGSAGSKYAISMQKRSEPQPWRERMRAQGRVLAVTSVDGINVISGQSAAYVQTGYVLSGFGAYEINGWRKSLQEVAAFTFAAPGESYASKTGRAANIGVIGVALFVEQAEPVPMRRPELEKSETMKEREQSSAAPSATTPQSAASGALAESKKDADLQSANKASADQSSAELSARARSTLAPGLGTQHGQREVSVTHNVAFQRASNSPDEVIMIRYDSLENMVRRGVLAYAQPVPVAVPTAMAFPRSAGYVPDPPRP